jgi:hypothetical protein
MAGLRLVGLLWGVIRGSAKTLVLLGFLASLSINVLFLVSSAFVGAASSLLSSTLGMRTVFTRQADELAELTVDIDQERRINRQLRSEVTEVRGAADNILRRVARRTGVSASREVASMPAEAIPYLGAAIIVGVTALEIRDMCANLQDLAELQQLIDPSAAPAPDAQTVCALEVPSKQEVVAALRSAPGQAWAAARDALPTVSELREIDITEIDWQEMASTGWDGAANAATNVGDATMDAATWLKRWWVDED